MSIFVKFSFFANYLHSDARWGSMYYMANEKEKSPAPATKLPEGRKSPDTPLDKKPEKPNTTQEARDAARAKFE